MESSFTETLKEVLEDAGMNIPQLALAMGCDKAAIRRWTYKMYWPDPESVIKIADIFNVSADYLFGRTDSKAYKKEQARNSFYERYAKLKEERGCTDYKVAKECGIRDSAICKWKTIKKFPTTESLIKLADFFGCSLDYLLGIGK